MKKPLWNYPLTRVTGKFDERKAELLREMLDAQEI